MVRDNRQEAYNYLINLASKDGYVTFDNVMDCADNYSLPIQDYNWLCNSIASNGIIIYNEAPSSVPATDNDEYDDFAQIDYEAVYNRIIELSPSLEQFVNDVRNIIPPQRQEINQLKYQIIDGNKYARSRMIEMHLRIALKLALQRADVFITGDTKYHFAQDSYQKGDCIIDASHYDTEKFFPDAMKKFLEDKLDNIDFYISNKLKAPFNYVEDYYE